MGRSGHGTPCSVSSACSFYDQDEDFFLEESSLGSLGQGEILVGPGIMGTAPEPQQQQQGSPSYFAPAQAMPETAASPGVKASLLPSRRSKQEAAGSAPRRKRSSSGSNSASAMQMQAASNNNNNLQLPRAASPKTGEILIKLQKLTQQQDPQHKVVNIHDPGPGPADAPGPGIKGKPLLVLEFHDISYTVHKRRDSGWLCGLRRRAGIGRARSPEGEREMQEPEQQAQGDESESQSGNNVNPMARRAKVLLKEVSGEARDGEILAVMGPSGSGKSTLIDALAQRIARDSLEGSITLNGEVVSNRLLRSISAYVMQDDLLFPMLTVHETLMFSANVRLPQSQSPAKKKARVAHLLEQLGLQRVANTIIGDEGHRGVSGGERRRVSIGIDIIHDPLLLFLDEPTSGLDSTSAYLVIRTLQRIAHTGSIVILSIHQPSYRILGLLDRLILLAHGQKIYGGPPSLMDDFFKDFGRPIPAHENSTEFALDLISELHQSPGGIKPLVEFYKAWSGIGSGSGKWRSRSGPMGHATDVRGAISASISRGKLVATRASFDLSSQQWSSAQEEQDQDSMVVKFANPWYCEIPVLIRRTVINISRTPELFLMRLGTVMVTGFLLATIFWGLDHSPKGVQERLGFFAFAMSTTYYTCADALPVFLQERYIFMRETTHNAYRKSSYVLANAIIYVPFLALLSMAFALVIWWAVGLSGGGQGFLFFFLIIWASFWAGNSFVTFLSAVMPNVMLGYTIVVAMLAYFLLLSGFFIARNRIPHYWFWFHYLSIIKYPYEAVLINEFHHTTACFETGAQILYGTPLAALPPSAVAGMLAALDSSLPAASPFKNLNVSSCVTDGRAILQNQYVTQLGKWACLGVTVGFGVLFRICFYIVLRLGGKNTRH